VLNLPRGRFSLRTRILLLTVFAALLPASAMIIHIYLQRNVEIAEATRNLAALARNTGDDLGAKVGVTTQLLYGLSPSQELDTEDKDACSQYLADVLKKYPQYTGILTIKPNGELHCDSLRTGRKLVLTDRAYFQQAMASTEPALELVFGRLTGVGVMQVAIASRDRRGAAKFVLLASISLDQFARQAAAAQPYPNTEVAIFNRAGILMAIQPARGGETLAGKEFANSELFRFARSGNAGNTAEMPGLTGERRAWALGTLPPKLETGLTVTLGVPSDELAAKAKRRMQVAFVVVAISSLLAFLAAWLLSELSIRRPLQRIMTRVARFRSGDLGARIGMPYPRSDIGELMQTLDRTSDEVRAQRTKIERHTLQQGLIAGFGRQALVSMDSDDLLAQATVIVREGLDAEFCEILQFSPDREALVFRAGSGWKHGSTERLINESGPGTQNHYILAAHKPVIINDLQHETRFAPSAILAAHGIRSGVVMLTDSGTREPIGVMGAYSCRAHNFTEESTDFLRSVTSILEAAIRRKQAEEARARLAAIVDNAQDAIIGRTLDGTITSWNAAAERMFGYTAAEAIGQDAATLVPPDRGEEVLHNHVLQAQGLAGREPETVRLAKDGTRIDVSLRLSPIKNETGVLVGASLTFRDIGERKRADAGQRLAASVFDNALDGIMITDENFRIVTVNRAFTHITGYSAAEAMGNSFGMLRSHRHDEAFYVAMRRTISETGSWQGEIWEKRKDGTPYCELLAISAVRDERGGIENYCAVFADITLRKTAEAELLRLNAELEERVAARTHELERTNRELEAFSYSVSHDLRAPLRHISGFSALVIKESEGKLDGRSAEHLGRIAAGAQRMDELIDDLLQLSRISRQEMRRLTVNLSELAAKVIKTLAQPERSVEIVIAPDMTAEGDPGLMYIALENLLKNAWKFTSRTERAKIELGSAERHGELVHFVRDNGAGFDMKYSAKLFGAFQRLHSPGQFEGTGIGLSIVQRIVAMHEGRIWAEGAVGEGATFYFTLGKLPAAAALTAV